MVYKGTIDFFWSILIEFNFLEWIVGIVTTFLIIYFFRAKIKLGNVTISDNKIKVPIINDSSYFMATNIIVEVALIKNNQTFHFKLDRNAFILIPRKCKKCNTEQNIRSFQTIDFEDLTIELMGVISYDHIINNVPENIKLRVRVHANHEFTNFGKAFEFNYIFNNGHFIKN
jgi:hypothetical protein